MEAVLREWAVRALRQAARGLCNCTARRGCEGSLRGRRETQAAPDKGKLSVMRDVRDCREKFRAVGGRSQKLRAGHGVSGARQGGADRSTLGLK